MARRGTGGAATEPHRRATISDIAQLAGVSKATVSKAFNQRAGVSEETRERILAIAQTHGWRPSARAVALTSGGSGAVGFLINRAPDLLSADPYFAELLSGIESGLSEFGYWLLLQIAEHKDPSSERDAYVALAQEQRVDGVFISESRVADPRFEIVQDLGIPAVIVSRPWSPTDLAWEGSEHPGGGMDDAVRHLYERGHRLIAYVSGPTDRSHVQYRTEALMSAVAEHGMAVVGIAHTDFSSKAGYEATARFLAQPMRPSAIIADNDLMAISGMRAARDAGLRVPEDLSIIGHDDIPLAQWTSPAVTTISQDVQGIGRQCARRLLSLLGVDVGPIDRLPDPALVVRESTGPVPG